MRGINTKPRWPVRPQKHVSRPASLPLLNATGQPRVTLSPRHEHVFKRAARKPRQEEKGLKFV